MGWPTLQCSGRLHGIDEVKEKNDSEPGPFDTDTLELIERNADPVCLRELWQVQLTQRPAAEALERVMRIPDLAPGWANKLAQRHAWLRRNSDIEPK